MTLICSGSKENKMTVSNMLYEGTHLSISDFARLLDVEQLSSSQQHDLLTYIKEMCIKKGDPNEIIRQTLQINEMDMVMDIVQDIETNNSEFVANIGEEEIEDFQSISQVRAVESIEREGAYYDNPEITNTVELL